METYHGYVRTPSDAIKLFEACRLGLLPRVQRRLSEKERQSIRSGSVFVWDEREAGMRRWTDGKSWSASRVSGSFLTYREMEGKRGGGFGNGRRGAGKTPESGRVSDEDHDDGEPEGYRYKADGLMKQSFSITTSTNQHLHLISYYSRPQPGQPDLPQPTSDPSLRGIVPVKGMYPESSMGEANQTPALTQTPMQQPPHYVIAPQHPQPPHSQQYPPHYAQAGYGWPPSPMTTPPYPPYTTAAPYPPPGHHHLPPQSSHGPPPPLSQQYSNYTHAPAHDRPTLPPPNTKSGVPHRSSRGLTPPRLHESPRGEHLQAAAQAAMMDRGSLSSRSSQGPLPALNSVAPGAMHTPPTRAMSVTPPRTAHSEGPLAGRASLSSLLHYPTPSNSESGSGHSGSNGSANSSPRMKGLPPPKEVGVSEDARALRMLDRKFCI